MAITTETMTETLSRNLADTLQSKLPGVGSDLIALIASIAGQKSKNCKHDIKIYNIR